MKALEKRNSLQQLSDSPDTVTLKEVDFATSKDKRRFQKSTVECSPAARGSISPSSSSRKMTSSQLVFDQTTGRHYVLKEVQTSTCVNKVGGGVNEPLIERRTLQERVSPTGKGTPKHDLAVSGFMTYKQRQTYAEQKQQGQLRVASPRSLLRKSTESMYLPRNDKFEGYSQFPRPRVPPETKQTDTFSRRKVSQSQSSMTMKELLELQTLRKVQQKKQSQQTTDFLNDNIGYLTGTHTGANNLKHTKANTSQVRKELAEPKATLKQRHKFKSDFKKDGAQIEGNGSSRNEVRGIATQFSSSQSRLNEFKKRVPLKSDVKNPATINRDGAIVELDTYIRAQLRKDPRLPHLTAIKTQSVMSAVRKSQRLKTDKDTMRNLKEVLSMRESLLNNQPGQTVNGRQLQKPVPLKASGLHSRRSSGVGNQESSPSQFEQPMHVMSTMSQNMSVDNVMASAEGLPGLRSNNTWIATSQRKIKPGGVNQSALNLLGSSSKRSLFNFAASKAGGVGSDAASMAMIPGFFDAGSSQISLLENRSPRKASQPSSSVFSLNRFMNDQLMQSQRGSRKDLHQVTREQLIKAKKRRSIIPGYSSMKPEHRVDTFLSKDSSRNNSQRGTSQNQSRHSLGAEVQKTIAVPQSNNDRVNGSKGRNSPGRLAIISSVEQLNLHQSIGSINNDSGEEDEYMMHGNNNNSAGKSKSRYMFSPYSASSPFSRHPAGFSCFGQAESQPASSAVKSLSQLKQAMIVPYKEKKVTPIEKLQPMKRETKGRFTENAAVQAQALSSKDREWTKRANPDYIRRQQDRAVVEETIFRKRQLTKTLKAVREEYKVGIRVSKIPPELAEQVKSLIK